MNKNEFKRILYGSIDGNEEYFEKLIELYEPLIKKYSKINGAYDEDLNQFLLIQIALNIPKFPIE